MKYELLQNNYPLVPDNIHPLLIPGNFKTEMDASTMKPIQSLATKPFQVFSTKGSAKKAIFILLIICKCEAYRTFSSCNAALEEASTGKIANSDNSKAIREMVPIFMARELHKFRSEFEKIKAEHERTESKLISIFKIQSFARFNHSFKQQNIF